MARLCSTVTRGMGQCLFHDRLGAWTSVCFLRKATHTAPKPTPSVCIPTGTKPTQPWAWQQLCRCYDQCHMLHVTCTRCTVLFTGHVLGMSPSLPSRPPLSTCHVKCRCIWQADQDGHPLQSLKSVRCMYIIYLVSFRAVCVVYFF